MRMFHLVKKVKCQHPNIRCVHGDEIIACGYRRARCLDCGRYLKGDLPEHCWYTGRPHLSAASR